MAVNGITQSGQWESAADFLDQLEAEQLGQCVQPESPPAAAPAAGANPFAPPEARPEDAARSREIRQQRIPLGALGDIRQYINPRDHDQ